MQVNAVLVEDLVEQAKKRLKTRQNGVPKKNIRKRNDATKTVLSQNSIDLYKTLKACIRA